MKKLLENNILRLRAPEPEDLDILYAWENDTELWEYGASIAPFSRFTIKQYLIDSKQDIYVNKQLRLMAELKETGKAVGTVDIYDFDPFHRRAGVGILIDKKFRNRGYALQVLTLLEEYAFDFMKLKQLYACIPDKNLGSIEVFTKAGYVQAGTLKEWLLSGDSFENVRIVQKIKPD
jgi:Acetyltransferases, including N-acetylases of ribosomal proteins